MQFNSEFCIWIILQNIDYQCNMKINYFFSQIVKAIVLCGNIARFFSHRNQMIKT
jgi:hypothetical protein